MTFHTIFVLFFTALSIIWNANAFQSSTTTTIRQLQNTAITPFTDPLRAYSSKSPKSLYMSRKNDKQNNDDDDDETRSNFSIQDTNILQERLHKLHLEILEEELSRPPNANLEPIQVVKAIMEGLWNSYDPLPDSGFRLLLHSSTSKWRREILKSLGVPMEPKLKRVNTKRQQRQKQQPRTVDYELVASALGSSMGRPNNQFAILVGEGDEEYVMDFSASESQLLDFGDGTCWVECRLRDKTTDELLVLTGWDLIQREDDGAWMIDWIYWQDFREAFRPGIGGRQEWLVNVRD
ncbi:hypothetical protein IV203_003514 [Nitzschia inconspicua]|uniref:Uncharacterized protein n=1 Tax=Nitzschia inconspicua TaxID=303405 RepID=A0A9K3L1Z7_9STRA|nr:hypothetical protein IV203_003514 [Nitzschia inconspicua]